MRARPIPRFAVFLWLAGAAPLTSASGGTAPAIGADAEMLAIELPADAAGTLLVEIDGYDVTAVVHIDAGVLNVPTRGLALAPGEHALRVLVSRDNGDIDTLLERTLAVGRVARQRLARHAAPR